MYQLQAPKKSNGCVMVFAALGVVALAVLALFAFAVFAVGGATNSAAIAPSTYTVAYQVGVDRDGVDWPNCLGFDTTYEMPSGTAQKPVSICSGTGSTEVDRRTGYPGDFVYLSVQNGKQYARIACRIYVDGRLLHQTYSEGQYVIASCSGSLP